jgi:hypothetical protein
MEISSETHGNFTETHGKFTRRSQKKLVPTTMITDSFKHLHGNTRLVISPLIIDGF